MSQNKREQQESNKPLQKRSSVEAIEIRKITAEITGILGEKQSHAFGKIRLLVQLRGEAFVREVLADTMEIEKQGGMMTKKGDRRRTPGGVFFKLARQRLTHEEDLLISPPLPWMQRARFETQFPAFRWNDRVEVIDNLKTQGQGEVSDVKIILQGHPQSTERREDLVILRMQHDIGTPPAMPRGLPAVADKMMPYTVIISSRHYEEAEATIKKDPKDKLYIEGFAAYDAETSDIVVIATRAITMKMHKKERRRELEAMIKQMEEAKERKEIAKRKNDENRHKQSESGKQKKKVQDEPSVADEARAEPIFGQFSDEPPLHLDEKASEKYIALLRAERTYRQRIADILLKPEDQRFGLETTQKLLHGIQKQIKELVDQTGG